MTTASLLGATATAALSLAPLPAAIAQETTEAPAGLEEIIVTSRYREENLQQTPLAISAFTGETLELMSLENVEDIGVIVPNAFIRPNVSNFGPNNTVGLRNVIQVDFLYAFEPAVGLYIDDVYHGTLTGSEFDLMDMERLEVLRGPQGTLFGKNSIGGAIRLVSRRPEGDDSGYIEATYGDYDRTDVKAVYDIGLVPDKLAMRVAGVSKNQDGYMETLDFTCDMIRRGTPELAGLGDGLGADGSAGGGLDGFPDAVGAGSPADNAFSFPELQPAGQRGCVTGTMGGEDLTAARVMLRWTPTDRFEINIAADHSDSAAEASGDALLRGAGPGLGSVIGGILYNGLWGINHTTLDRFVTETPYQSYATWADPITGQSWDRHYKHEQDGISVSFDYDIGENTHFRAILANRSYLSDWTSDSDFSPIEITTTNNLEDHNQDTVEFQFTGTVLNNRLEWTAGAFYYDARSFLGGRVELAEFNFIGIIPEFDQNDKFWTENTSAFFHIVADLTDRLSFSGGVRSTNEDKIYTFDHTGFLTVDEPLLYGISRSDWKATFDYRFTDNIFGYFGVSTGYRSDGAQPRPWVRGQLQSTPHEELEETSIGVKADLLDNRLRINATAFNSDYDPRVVNMFGSQCNLRDDPDPGFFYQGLVANACPPGTPQGDLPPAQGGPTGFPWFGYFANTGEVDGFEMELSAFPTDNLSFNYTLGLNKFESPDRHPTALLQPRRNVSAGFQYDIRLANGGTLSPRLDWFYQSKRTNGPTTLDQVCPQWCIPEYDYMNGRLTYLAPNDEFSLSLAVTNLTDEFWWYQLGSDTGASGALSRPRSGVPSAPRMWNLTLRKNF